METQDLSVCILHDFGISVHSFSVAAVMDSSV